MNFFIWMLDFSLLFFLSLVCVCVYICLCARFCAAAEIRRGKIVRYKKCMGNQTPSCRKEVKKKTRKTTALLVMFEIGPVCFVRLSSAFLCNYTSRAQHILIDILIHSFALFTHIHQKNKCTEEKSNGFPFCIRFLLFVSLTEVFFFLFPFKSGVFTAWRFSIIALIFFILLLHIAKT